MAKMSIPLPDKLKKSMFWIVIGVLSLVALIVWWLGTAAVADMREKGITEIKGYFATVQGANPTANADTVKKMQDQAGTRKQSMDVAWQRVYDRQQKELVWPEVELDANGATVKPGLPKEFVDVAKAKLRAPEWLPANQELLEISHKEMYRNYAKRQISDLCDIIGATYRIDERRASASNQSTSATDKGADTAQPNEICIWPTASQQNAAAMLSFTEGANPLTQDVVYAQENVWIYQSLFKIIKATNDSFTETSANNDPAQHYNAPVKKIHEISIGPNFAVREAKGGRTSSGSGGDDAEFKIPDALLRAAERYVNERGQRLKGEELLALEDPNPATDRNPNVDTSRNHAQYKLMPVFMRLEVDQRYLGRLFVECANSPLTVQIKDVAFNVQGHADRESSSTQETGFNSGPKETTNFYDMTVDITGHIYLYYDPKGATPATADDAAPAEADAPVNAGG